MPHRKLNALMASLVFAISFIVYAMTVAPTTPFWDCGEFIACSYILGIPHPPGAPLYVLLGRVFSMLPFGVDSSLDPAQIPGVLTDNIALRVNMISPIFSAFTAMLTYLIIVRLILLFWKREPESLAEKITLYAAGVVGALGFAFSDSQWFNSVEAEVYAGSMFFTAIVIWLILKWQDEAETAPSDRYILLIFYLLGLAIGVHLLNLLALPTIAMIFFNQRYQRTGRKADAFGELLRMLAVAGAGGLTMYYGINNGLVQGLPWLMEQGGVIALVLVLAALVVAVTMAGVNRQRLLGMAAMSVLLIIIGYSTYSAIFIRSTLDPAIDENNPDTAERLVSYLRREQYGEVHLTPRRAPFWEYQIKQMYIRYFNWQFIGKGTTLDQQGRIVEVFSLRGLWGIPFLVGLFGMVYHFYKDWRRALPILTLFLMTGLAIVIYLNQDDPQPRERDYAYTGSFFAFALWIGIGVAALVDYAHNLLQGKKTTAAGAVAGRPALHSPLAAGVAGLLITLVPGNMLFSILPGVDWFSNFREHNRKGDYVAFDYSYNILASCAPNAIIFTNGDNDTFPLWFLQYVHNIRRDVRVVNLSLLNTDWYIKQLRDDEPKVPIYMSDASIAALRPIEWKTKTVTISVPGEIYEQYYQEALRLDANVTREETPVMRLEVKPTYENLAIRVQDIMILRILEDNQFRRPVYFAVTVSPENKIGLEPYMRMDGLAFRVLPVKIERGTVDPGLMWTNLNEKFRYRNLDNPKVYYNDNVISLLQNYRSAFLHLAQYHLYRRENEQVVKVLDRMSQIMPESVIPTSDFRINEAIGMMYAQAGRPEEMTKRYHHFVVNEYPRLQELRDRLSFADYLNYRGQRALAESLVQEIIKKESGQREPYQWLARFYNMTGERDKAIAALEQLLARFPDDQTARMQLQQMRGQASDSAAPAGPSDGRQPSH
ncbi:MAG: DUF2723 domain-containing protein [candidate division KSB1 bacterium]|nr:DUF2723 domain-containing protein [candidate division KSB1 bacterium]MDZ7275250.1 DUF2723 domain-containing protein [candidate division KSB1 bacterium]MDZ7287418.1 DUF2723 domain-containing protein [candidate division KSB1 bacterium]MDZ7299532.1 DUF2723 domain-containing protein [candidate division KSB1 bacterium]MDZ7309117.1 DUF2723 domain-containing protein [candidate division KSB1 bacterium]